MLPREHRLRALRLPLASRGCHGTGARPRWCKEARPPYLLRVSFGERQLGRDVKHYLPVPEHRVHRLRSRLPMADIQTPSKTRDEGKVREKQRNINGKHSRDHQRWSDRTNQLVYLYRAASKREGTTQVSGTATEHRCHRSETAGVQQSPPQPWAPALASSRVVPACTRTVPATPARAHFPTELLSSTGRFSPNLRTAGKDVFLSSQLRFFLKTPPALKNKPKLYLLLLRTSRSRAR